MNYEVKQNESELNYDKQNHLKNFAILSVSLFGILLVLFFIISNLLNVLIKIIPEGKEYEIFAGDTKSVKTPKELAIIEISDKLKPCINLKNNFEILMIENELPNAFATLTNKIYVTSSLLKYVKSENSLAFVLAHEMAHFKHRDHLKGIGNSAIWTLIFANSGYDIISKLIDSKFSKTQEIDADNEALKVLNCAYGHIGGASDFFENLSKIAGNENIITNIFGSHPLLKQRINNINNSKFPKGNVTALNIN